MLVLTLKRNQSLVINGNVVVTLTDVQADKCRLGITADRSIPVDRAEIHALKAAAKESPRG